MQTPTGPLILLGAALLAGPALAQNATISQSGATVAAERTAPRPGDTASSAGDGVLASEGRKMDYDWDEPVELRTGDTAGSQSTPRGETGAAGGGGVQDQTRVRAPAFTYSNDNSNRDHIDQDAQATRRGTSSQGNEGGSDDQPIYDRWGRQGALQDGSERHVEGSTRGETRTDESAPVNGIGGLGGGRYTFKPTTRSGAADSTDGSPPSGEPGLRSTSTEGGFAPVRPAEFRSGTGGPATANVSVVRNSCVAPNTVELVTLSGLNTLEYTFQRLPNGPNVVFAGIANPTSLNNPRRFVLPNGTYRLTFRHPDTTPIGVWPQNVVIQPHHMVGGTCVPIAPRTRPGLPTSPVQ